MFSVLECAVYDHDWTLVVIAATVWLIGSHALFLLLRRSERCLERRRRFWIAAAALAAGTGIWATHFIAMLAYNGPTQLSYDPVTTFASVVLAVACFWLALLMGGSGFTLGRALGAGLATSAGVASMHFTGMAAIIAPVSIRYEIFPVIVAGGFAFLAFSGAFAFFGRAAGRLGIFVPAIFAFVGVVALHFIAMSATVLAPDPTKEVVHGFVSKGWLVPAIVIASLSLIGLVLLGAFLDSVLTDLRGLADAAIEGLAIVTDGKIVEANFQLIELIGLETEKALIGSDPTRWLLTDDALPLLVLRERPVEGIVRKHDGSECAVDIMTRVIEYRGRSSFVLAVRDLSEAKAAEQEIAHLATHDPLTGLANRVRFSSVLNDLVESGEPFALLALDLDRFKAVNDVFGHAAGDEILCRVATMLNESTRDEDLVARIGGDEFLILQKSVGNDSEPQRLAKRILTRFGQEMDPARDPMAVGVSIGVATYPRDAHTADELRHNADVALYRAKEGGRGIACFFDKEMDRVMRERRELEHDLRLAISRSELHLVFQPLVETAGKQIMGYEALLRWTHPVRGNVSPEIFIPIAEETGTIVSIGEWVLRQSCDAAVQWPDHINVAVNVSPVQFQLPNLASIVESALLHSGLRPDRLELEITEGVMLRNRNAALATLYRLKAIGVRVVMDDFGTGYSSLSNLQAFPFDKIKIDGSFVSSMGCDQAARSIIRAIVGLGRSLNLPVVAEGVETEAQRRMVLEEGCPQAQGYLFGFPSQAQTVTGPKLLSRAS